MSMAPLDEPSVTKATLLLVGPVFLGALISWMIFGISIAQLYIYHISFPNDPRWTQLLVLWVFILDIFTTIVAGAMGWHVLCAGWGRTTDLIQPGWTFSAIAAGDGITATTVQIFYAWRIWVLSRWSITPGLIVLIALAQLGSTISIAAGIANLQNIAELQPFFPRTIIWLGGGALTDIIIAVSMVYLLTMAQKHTRIAKGGDRAIDRLIHLSVETGCLTAISAICELGLFLAPSTKNTNLHLIFALILGKIYSNMMMTSLNSRAGAQQMTEQHLISEGSSGSIADTQRTFRTRGKVSNRTNQAPTVVHITSHTEMSTDRPGSTSASKGKADNMEMMEYKPKNDIYSQSFPYV